MAIPKKGSRLVTVDGTVYRRRVRHKPTYCQGNGWTSLRFAAERAERPAFTLMVAEDEPAALLGERVSAGQGAFTTASISTGLP